MVHRLQSRNIDSKDIKSYYPATILSIFFEITFSGFDYLLLLGKTQLVCKGLHIPVRKIFYLAENQCLTFFHDYVHFPAPDSEIPRDYGISL